MLRSMFLLGVLFSSFALASTVTPRLVVTGQAACVLADNDSGESEVRCWKKYGGKLRIPELHHPTALAGSGDSLCAIDSGGVQCWIDDDNFHHHWYGIDGKLQSMLGGLPEPRLLSGGEWDGYCVWDETKGYVCAKGWVLSGDAPKIPNVGEPVEMAIGSGVACAILPDRTLHCWGTFKQLETTYDMIEPALLEIPKDLKDPHDLTLAYGRACVIDENQLRCWGNWKKEKPPRIKNPQDVFFAHQLTDDWTWLDSGVPHFADDYLKWTAKERAVLAQSSAGRTCVLTTKEILCEDGGYWRGFTHGLHVAYSSLGELTATLKAAAAATYQSRRHAYDVALRLFGQLPVKERFFVFRALAPLFEGTDSSAFHDKLLPVYQGAVDYWGKQLSAGALVDFPHSETNLTSALQLLAALVPAEDGWTEFKAAVGVALAEKGETEALNKLEAAAARAPFASALSGRYAPEAQTMQGLLTYLNSRG